jgi:hypothetical protein
MSKAGVTRYCLGGGEAARTGVAQTPCGSTSVT